MTDPKVLIYEIDQLEEKKTALIISGDFEEACSVRHNQILLIEELIETGTLKRCPNNCPWNKRCKLCSKYLGYIL